MEYEVGVDRCGLFRRMIRESLTVWLTWRYARQQGEDPTAWYGVYHRGSQMKVANCGPLPGAHQLASKIVDTLST